MDAIIKSMAKKAGTLITQTPTGTALYFAAIYQEEEVHGFVAAEVPSGEKMGKKAAPASKHLSKMTKAASCDAPESVGGVLIFTGTRYYFLLNNNGAKKAFQSKKPTGGLQAFFKQAFPAFKIKNSLVKCAPFSTATIDKLIQGEEVTHRDSKELRSLDPNMSPTDTHELTMILEQLGKTGILGAIDDLKTTENLFQNNPGKSVQDSQRAAQLAAQTPENEERSILFFEKQAQILEEFPMLSSWEGEPHPRTSLSSEQMSSLLSLGTDLIRSSGDQEHLPMPDMLKESCIYLGTVFDKSPKFFTSRNGKIGAVKKLRDDISAFPRDTTESIVQISQTRIQLLNTSPAFYNSFYGESMSSEDAQNIISQSQDLIKILHKHLKDLPKTSTEEVEPPSPSSDNTLQELRVASTLLEKTPHDETLANNLRTALANTTETGSEFYTHAQELIQLHEDTRTLLESIKTSAETLSSNQSDAKSLQALAGHLDTYRQKQGFDEHETLFSSAEKLHDTALRMQESIKELSLANDALENDIFSEVALSNVIVAKDVLSYYNLSTHPEQERCYSLIQEHNRCKAIQQELRLALDAFAGQAGNKSKASTLHTAMRRYSLLDNHNANLIEEGDRLLQAHEQYFHDQLRITIDALKADVSHDSHAQALESQLQEYEQAPDQDPNLIHEATSLLAQYKQWCTLRSQVFDINNQLLQTMSQPTSEHIEPAESLLFQLEDFACDVVTTLQDTLARYKKYIDFLNRLSPVFASVDSSVVETPKELFQKLQEIVFEGNLYNDLYNNTLLDDARVFCIRWTMFEKVFAQVVDVSSALPAKENIASEHAEEIASLQTALSAYSSLGGPESTTIIDAKAKVDAFYACERKREREAEDAILAQMTIQLPEIQNTTPEIVSAFAAEEAQSMQEFLSSLQQEQGAMLSAQQYTLTEENEQQLQTLQLELQSHAHDEAEFRSLIQLSFFAGVTTLSDWKKQSRLFDETYNNTPTETQEISEIRMIRQQKDAVLSPIVDRLEDQISWYSEMKTSLSQGMLSSASYTEYEHIISQRDATLDSMFDSIAGYDSPMNWVVIAEVEQHKLQISMLFELLAHNKSCQEQYHERMQSLASTHIENLQQSVLSAKMILSDISNALHGDFDDYVENLSAVQEQIEQQVESELSQIESTILASLRQFALDFDASKVHSATQSSIQAVHASAILSHINSAPYPTEISIQKCLEQTLAEIQNFASNQSLMMNS